MMDALPSRFFAAHFSHGVYGTRHHIHDEAQELRPSGRVTLIVLATVLLTASAVALATSLAPSIKATI